MDQQTRNLLRFFLRAYPGRTATMVLLLLVSGLSEGIGVAALLPVLELGTLGAGQEPSTIARVTERAFQLVGLVPTLGSLLLLIVGAMILKGAFRWLAMREVGFVVARVSMDLRLRLIQGLVHAEWDYFTSNRTGYFASSISYEAQRAAGAYRQACTALALLVQVLVYGVIVILVSWQLALLGLAVGGVVLFALRGFVGATRAAGQEQVRVLKSLMARLVEVLPGLKPIKAMAREEQVLPLLREETRGFYEAQKKQVMATETLVSLQEPLLIVMIAAGLYGVLSFTSTPFPVVLVLTFLCYRLIARMNAVQKQYNRVAAGAHAFTSIMEHINTAEKAIEVRAGSRDVPALGEGIRFEGISFSYGNAPVLNDVSLHIPTGTLVALLGPSGSGKTSLADLLVGLRRPDAGRVLVGGVDLQGLDLRQWRARIGYVPQDLVLFRDTVLNNVTLGDPDISRDRVERALRLAGAWEFVSNLPEGMDCPVGERGGTMSGGERQRIAIARALVGDPDVLVLDEATTALDPATEREICESLVTLKGKVTMLAISHQSALRDIADLVFEVRDGRVWPASREADSSPSGPVPP